MITRCYKRPSMLAANIASLQRQSDPDYEQIFLVDEVGLGIGESYRRMAQLRDEIGGGYVFILDDDDMLVSETLIADLKSIVREHDPDVIMLKMDHGRRGILPDEGYWQRPPVISHIGCSAFVVRRKVWERHRDTFSNSYAGDFDFIASVFSWDYEIYWFDCVASKVQRISLGEPE